MKRIEFDASIAAYILNPTNNKLKIENLAEQFLDIDISEILKEDQNKQINLFDTNSEDSNIGKEEKYTLYAYILKELQEITIKKLEEIGSLKLFKEIDMPTVTVLADMQWNGMYADEEELNKFGDMLKEQLEIKTKIIL